MAGVSESMCDQRESKSNVGGVASGERSYVAADTGHDDQATMGVRIASDDVDKEILPLECSTRSASDSLMDGEVYGVEE